MTLAINNPFEALARAVTRPQLPSGSHRARLYDALCAGRRDVTLTQLRKRIGFEGSTVERELQRLIDDGFAERIEPAVCPCCEQPAVMYRGIR